MRNRRPGRVARMPRDRVARWSRPRHGSDHVATACHMFRLTFNYLLDIAFQTSSTVRRQSIRNPRIVPQIAPGGERVAVPPGASPDDVVRSRATGAHRSDRRGARACPGERCWPRNSACRPSRSARTSLVLEIRAPPRSAPTAARSPSDRSRPELAFEIRERLQTGREVADRRRRARPASTTARASSWTPARPALSVARHIKVRGRWSQLTVITNSLRIASELAGHPGITVLMLGGRVRWEALSVVGQLGDGLFSRINVQKAFLGAAGFTVESGLADATEEEAQIKGAMVAATREVDRDRRPHEVGAARRSPTFCPTDQIGVVLTDRDAPAGDGRGAHRARHRGPIGRRPDGVPSTPSAAAPMP